MDSRSGRPRYAVGSATQPTGTSQTLQGFRGVLGEFDSRGLHSHSPGLLRFIQCGHEKERENKRIEAAKMATSTGTKLSPLRFVRTVCFVLHFHTPEFIRANH